MQRGFVRKRGSFWTAAYYVTRDGKRRQVNKGGFRTKKEAQAYLTAALAAVQRGEVVEPSKLTFGEYLTDHWLPIMQRSVRPGTWDSYTRLIRNHVLPTLGHVPLQELTPSHLDRLYSQLLVSGHQREERGLSSKTVHYVHTTIHKALRDAERKQLVLRNAAQAADPPKARHSGSAEMQTWNVAEVNQFLDAMRSHRLFALYLLAVTTGMRRGEVLGLRWSDVDFATGRVAVRQTVLTTNYQVSFGTPKTKRGRRSIAIDSVTIEALREHRRQQRAERKLLEGGFEDLDLVFCRLDGTPIHPDFVSQTFDRTVARLGLRKIRLHDLRHTHATLGLAAGIPAKVMSDRLGHATVAFTQDVYMHAIPQLEADAADQMSALLFGMNVIDSEELDQLTELVESETIGEAEYPPGGLIAGWSSGSSIGS